MTFYEVRLPAYFFGFWAPENAAERIVPERITGRPNEPPVPHTTNIRFFPTTRDQMSL
jgi:hypothetical protein